MPLVSGIWVGAIAGAMRSRWSIVLAPVGRLIHGVLVLAPTAAGAAHAVAWIRPRDPSWDRPAGIGVRRVFGGAVSVALVLLAVMVARPVTTDPIVGPGGSEMGDEQLRPPPRTGLCGRHLGPARHRQVVRELRTSRDVDDRSGGRGHHRALPVRADRFDDEQIYVLGESYGTLRASGRRKGALDSRDSVCERRQSTRWETDW